MENYWTEYCRGNLQVLFLLDTVFIPMWSKYSQLNFSSSRGGRYTEEDAKFIVIQILSVVAFCHLQGVVHRDLKPEVVKKFKLKS